MNSNALSVYAGETSRKRKTSSHSESSSGEVKSQHIKSKKSKKRRRSYSSSSSDSEHRKKKHKVKKNKMKHKKDKKKVKKDKEEEKSNITIGPEIPADILQKSKTMAPMTKEEWEKKQSVIKRVYDAETGRHRLIKGSGEVLEEIVSKDMHKQINKQATLGDGNFFQTKLPSNFL